MYDIREYCDMIMIYGECRGRAGRAQVVYAERYPRRRHPDVNVFLRLERRMRESGQLRPERRINAGRNRIIRNPRNEERILHLTDRNPRISTRRIARELNVGRSTVHRVLKDENLYPYHFTKVQKLTEADYPRRMEFCRWMLDKCEVDGNFIDKILWTDEALFTREGVFNTHNSHYWCVNNPFLTKNRGFQYRWKLNVWCGILGDRILGPYLLPDNLRGNNYRVFLEYVLPELLEDIPLQVRQTMWLQQDGAPAHNSRLATNYLNAVFPDRWIGTAGPGLWPARSPDLTVLDFFFWGYVKEIVYATEPATAEIVIGRIHAAVATIDAAMLQRTRASLMRRLNIC